MAKAVDRSSAVPGDPARTKHDQRLHMSREALERFNNIIGFTGEYRKFYATRTCFFNHTFSYDESGAATSISQSPHSPSSELPVTR